MSAIGSILLCYLLALAVLFDSVQGLTNHVRLSQLPLQTNGRYFTDRYGKRIKLACLNWHGAHMNTFVVSGLHIKTSKEIARKVKELGFNCIRLNWSVELVLTDPFVNPEVIAAMSNIFPPNSGVRAMTVFQQVVSDLASENLMVILDNHMSDAGWCCDPRDGNGLWFNERWSTEDYESAWEKIVTLFKDQPYVVAVDLRNEVRPDIRYTENKSLFVRFPSWGTGDKILTPREWTRLVEDVSRVDLVGWEGSKQTVLRDLSDDVKMKVELHDWKLEVEKVSKKIHKINPNLIIIVQGVFDVYSYKPSFLSFLLNQIGKIPKYSNPTLLNTFPKELNSYRQLQNLTGIMKNPPNIPSDKLAFTAHLYPFFYEESNMKFDGTDPSYESFAKELDEYWGDFVNKRIGPLWIGEIGVEHTELKGIWRDYIIRYIKEHDMDFSYWPLGDAKPEIDENGQFLVGSDSFSLLDPAYNQPANEEHYLILRDLIF